MHKFMIALGLAVAGTATLCALSRDKQGRNLFDRMLAPNPKPDWDAAMRKLTSSTPPPVRFHE